MNGAAASGGHELSEAVPVAGVDVGGSSIKAVLVDDRNQVLARARRPTPQAAAGEADRVPAVLRAVRDTLTDLAAVRAPSAVGVVVPGVVDERAGVARYSANLGWREVPFRAQLRESVGERLGIPVAFGHDVRAGGLAEARLGAARGCESAAFVPVGTGIAAALLVNGSPLSGAGFAGELGHMDAGHSRPCGCGATGCLEAVASCAAIARTYGTGDSADVLAAAERGEPRACEVLDEAIDALGRGLRTMITLFAPEAVVLGGGLFRAELPLRRVSTWLEGNLRFQRMPELRAAELGDDAGCLGAALLGAGLAGTEPERPGTPAGQAVRR
jgi:glucokinase